MADIAETKSISNENNEVAESTQQQESGDNSNNKTSSRNGTTAGRKGGRGFAGRNNRKVDTNDEEEGDEEASTSNAGEQQSQQQQPPRKHQPRQRLERPATKFESSEEIEKKISELAVVAYPDEAAVNKKNAELIKLIEEAQDQLFDVRGKLDREQETSSERSQDNSKQSLYDKMEEINERVKQLYREKDEINNALTQIDQEREDVKQKTETMKKDLPYTDRKIIDQKVKDLGS